MEKIFVKTINSDESLITVTLNDGTKIDAYIEIGEDNKINRVKNLISKYKQNIQIFDICECGSNNSCKCK
jgi:hypothetical protein